MNGLLTLFHSGRVDYTRHTLAYRIDLHAHLFPAKFVYYLLLMLRDKQTCMHVYLVH